MSLVFSCSPASLLLMMADSTDIAAAPAEAEFDTLELRNRTVTETLSPLEDLGQETKVRKLDNLSQSGLELSWQAEENGVANGSVEEEEKYDKLVLRNRTVTETMSKVEDFGQNQENGHEEKEGNEEEEEEEEGEKYDKLELRNRTVEETLSLVEDFGKNQKDEETTEEEPDAKKPKFDTLALRNRDVTETLSPLEN